MIEEIEYKIGQRVRIRGSRNGTIVREISGSESCHFDYSVKPDAGGSVWVTINQIRPLSSLEQLADTAE